VATVRWTAEAERWLEDIYEHIATDNPRAAAETVEGIYQRAQSLADIPEIGERYRVSKREVRILLFSHYRIAYLVKDDQSIDILGVFHGALDIGRYQL
jgi:plasmid stabilization system protein ParE